MTHNSRGVEEIFEIPIDFSNSASQAPHLNDSSNCTVEIQRPKKMTVWRLLFTNSSPKLFLSSHQFTFLKLVVPQVQGIQAVQLSAEAQRACASATKPGIPLARRAPPETRGAGTPASRPGGRWRDPRPGWGGGRRFPIGRPVSHNAQHRAQEFRLRSMRPW